jgi:hypothetical protein
MPTNLYFNNYGSKPEQHLVEDLMIEAIKMYGFDGYYIPNTNEAARDLLYGEDPLKKFSAAYPVELYLSSSTEYMGEQEFFSKFGLEIRNDVNVMLARRTFAQRVPQTYERPREGDLIYIPFTGASGQGELYEIKMTIGNKDFFALGRKSPYFYELQLAKFKYSSEVIETGIPDIDASSQNEAFAIDLVLDTALNANNYTKTEIVYQSTDNTYANANVTAYVADWDRPTGVLKVTNILGEFANGIPVIGLTSNARYQYNTSDPLDNPQIREPFGNLTIQTEADSIIDFSESNPFSGL